MIRLDAVSFAYADAQACLRGIQLHVLPGECVVLTGRSGSGKTTVTRVINGLAPSYYEGRLRGEVLIHGRLSSDIPQWEKGKTVGSVFQDPSSQFFSGELKGELAFACENYGLPSGEVQRRVDGTIAHMGLSGMQNQFLDTLSSGEKQKVAIASVRAASPLVYVFDEPSANLDEEASLHLAEIMDALKAEGHTLIVSEHRLSYLMDIADRFIYMDDGRFARSYTPEELETLTDAHRRTLGLRSLRKATRSALAAPSAEIEPVLELCNIGYVIKDNVILDSISFKAAGGQCIAITGRNGAGKTTLSQIVCGLKRERQGECLIHGKSIPPRKRRQHVWYSANDTNTQFFTPSVEEELMLLCDKDEKTLDRARELLRKLGLYAYKNRHPVTLSGGQKQRLSIACGMLSDRDILIFDEPTSGLDGDNLHIVSGMLREAAAAGKVVLVVTHDNELITDCCTHVVCM